MLVVVDEQGFLRQPTQEEIENFVEPVIPIEEIEKTQEERLVELEEAIQLLLSGATE